MSAIEVYRHGSRWAVRRSGDSMPEGEYETREQAEVATRGLGGEVRVLDDEAGNPERADPAAAGDTSAMDAAMDSGEERGRLPQAGL